MGSHSATLGRASVPASVLLEQLAQAAVDAVSFPAPRTRHRAPEIEQAAEPTRRVRQAGAQVYGAAALAVTIVGGAAAATASFGSGVVSDVSSLAADLTVGLPAASAPATHTEAATQVLPAAAAVAAPAGAELPQAKGSLIASSILDTVGSAQKAAAAAPAAAVAAAAPAAAPAKAAPAKPAPAQAISLGSPVAAKALSAAMSKIGKPYVWGAAGPNAFDCSGLVQWAYKQWGISLPHSSAAQSKVGTAVAKSDLRPGDLVFFYSPVSHVGIYVGNGNVLNASEPGEPVKLSKLANMPFHNARRL